MEKAKRCGKCRLKPGDGKLDREEVHAINHLAVLFDYPRSYRVQDGSKGAGVRLGGGGFGVASDNGAG